MSPQFQNVMEKIGHDCKVVFTDIEKYLPLGESVAIAAYPPSAPIVGVVNVINDLVVKLVTVIEQKYALAGVATGTGLQKSADVIAVSAPIVGAILQQVGVKTDTNKYIQSIIDATVAGMKIPVLDTTATPVVPTAQGILSNPATPITESLHPQVLQPAPIS